MMMIRRIVTIIRLEYYCSMFKENWLKSLLYFFGKYFLIYKLTNAIDESIKKKKKKKLQMHCNMHQYVSEGLIGFGQLLGGMILSN